MLYSPFAVLQIGRGRCQCRLILFAPTVLPWYAGTSRRAHRYVSHTIGRMGLWRGFRDIQLRATLIRHTRHSNSIGVRRYWCRSPPHRSLRIHPFLRGDGWPKSYVNFMLNTNSEFFLRIQWNTRIQIGLDTNNRYIRIRTNIRSWIFAFVRF